MTVLSLFNIFKFMGRRGRLNIADERFFFVTTSSVRHTKVFGNNIYSELLVKSIKHYQFKYKFDILAYVIMPSHYHWIVEAKPNFGTISSIMRDKKNTRHGILWKRSKKMIQNL